MTPTPQLAVVAIGRNEGERLKLCLRSVLSVADVVVYVDSGSSDGSSEFARSIGVEVVALDMSRPFSAARARNEGLARLKAICPEVRFVQFVDGDCEVHPDWLRMAQEFLNSHPRVAAVSGRLRERHPQASVYNLLCDLEWNTPLGESKACGGIVLMRREALEAAGGYREDVIAGEEPELCVRLRALDWLIWRIDCDMAWHDAAMTHFKQWWTRSVRCGYAYAMGARLHGAAPERHWVTERNRALAWGLLLPLAIASSALVAPPVALGLGLAYPLQMGRLALRSTLSGPKWSAVDGALKVIGKFAEARGVIKFIQDEWQGRAPKIIEYK
jgi:GT2 family glycosyltransferase